ncbi:MAG: orotidine 5'-phosphate decarboxylase [Candidatus Heimdallarchaeota archaeon]|nr:orotidine 5'-phosphate decarboxylase [Candidatus Heimdallarchaeota archaeon]
MDKFQALALMERKESQLCIGIDLTGDDQLNRALELIDSTHDLASSFKPNRQYWLEASPEEMKQLTCRIAKYRCFSIIDHKLSDIGSSNQAALTHAKLEGFDMITISPFPGNMQQNALMAKEIGIGLIQLVLMSNPEAAWIKDTGLYRDFAKQAELYADGMVVGTTNHCTLDVMQEIGVLSPTTIVLAPGIGAQGGSVQEVLMAFGKHALFNVSRGITKADDPRAAAEEYYNQIHD